MLIRPSESYILVLDLVGTVVHSRTRTGAWSMEHAEGMDPAGTANFAFVLLQL